MRHFILPTAIKLGITKRIGWHTFRHSYSTLLKANGADIKVMQELLRHASTRVTLDTYTQAVTPAKRAAQTAVVAQFFSTAKNSTGKAAFTKAFMFVVGSTVEINNNVVRNM